MDATLRRTLRAAITAMPAVGAIVVSISVSISVSIVVAVSAGPAASAGEGLKALRATDPAVRTAALRDIARTPRDELKPDAAFLRTALRRAIERDDVPEIRGLAARALLHLDGDSAIAAVLDAMRTERDPDAERHLAAAWAGIATDPARRALADAARDDDDVRLAALAAEALGSLPGGLGADDLLVFGDGLLPWPAEAGACLGLRGVRETRAVDALVRRARHDDPAVRSAARESLAFLTGADRGRDPKDWETWWTKARDAFRFPDGPPDGARAPVAAAPPAADGTNRTSDRPADPRTATWAEFFGIPLRGPRVAFVIDYSQSMWGARRERAEKELVAAVKSLPTTARVSVILFNEKVWRFRDAPFPARPQEKSDLAVYLAEIETKSYTNIHDAVEDALELLDGGVNGGVNSGVNGAAGKPGTAPGVDDIVVLSDGVPNRGKLRDPDRICEALRARNAGRARIHAVALADAGSGLLRRLAAENGGTFALVE